MRKCKKYEYEGKIYSEEKYFGDGNSISDLLYDLEKNKEIEISNHNGTLQMDYRLRDRKKVY